MTVQQMLAGAQATTVPRNAAPVKELSELSAAAPDPKLAKLTGAAQSFEAMMLNEMLKPLHFGAGVEDGAEESEGGSSDTVKGMATDALGRALAAAGGVGIARKIVKQVTAEEASTKVQRGETKVQ